MVRPTLLRSRPTGQLQGPRQHHQIRLHLALASEQTRHFADSRREVQFHFVLYAVAEHGHEQGHVPAVLRVHKAVLVVFMEMNAVTAVVRVGGPFIFVFMGDVVLVLRFEVIQPFEADSPRCRMVQAPSRSLAPSRAPCFHLFP